MKPPAPGIRLHIPKFLRKSPWLAVSLLINAAVVLALTLVSWTEPKEETVYTVQTTVTDRLIDPLVKEVRPDCVDLPYEESLGKADFLSDAPYTAIGIGGGAGGAFVGKGGSGPEEFDREGYDAIVEPGFMRSIMWRVISFGAAAPGIKTELTTMSAADTSSSRFELFEKSVFIRLPMSW